MRFAGRTQSLFLLSLLAFAFVSASSTHAQAPKLRVAYTAFAGTFTVLWVGKDAGLYQKHGADMELLYIGSSTRAVQALLAGDIDIVYSAAGAVVDANLAGADLVMVGCQYDTGQSSFFTTSPIASVGDLKGKAVGVSRFGAFSDFVARHVLKKNHLQPIKDVALIQLGGTQEIIAAMQKNLVQGGSISLPLTLQARKFGFRENCSQLKPLRCRSTTAASSSRIPISKPNGMSSREFCAPPSPPMICRFKIRRSPNDPSASTREQPMRKHWTRLTKRMSKITR